MRKPTPAAAVAAPADMPGTPPADQAENQVSENTGTNDDATTNKTAEGQDDRVEVRVLLAFGEHQPNEVVLVLETELPALKSAGHVDDDPDAVDYAKALIA